MGIYYTTGWAKKIKPSWDEWILKAIDDSVTGVRVLVQEFVPRGNSCLDSQYECWRFWDAMFKDGNVYYNNDSRRTKDGLLVYGDNEPIGDVFPTRIVKWHADCWQEGRRFVDCHAPIYEPNYLVRNFVHIPFGPNHHKMVGEIRAAFPYSYEIKVNGGVLMTVFGEEVEEALKTLT